MKCPKCNKSSIYLAHHDEKKGVIKYKCNRCGWTKELSIEQQITISKDTIDVEDRDTRMILVIPENAGLGTKKLAPIGNSQHIIIDQRMMNAAGVEIGDLVHVLIWRIVSKPEEASDHE